MYSLRFSIRQVVITTAFPDLFPITLSIHTHLFVYLFPTTTFVIVDCFSIRYVVIMYTPTYTLSIRYVVPAILFPFLFFVQQKHMFTFVCSGCSTAQHSFISLMRNAADEFCTAPEYNSKHQNATHRTGLGKCAATNYCRTPLCATSAVTKMPCCYSAAITVAILLLFCCYFCHVVFLICIPAPCGLCPSLCLGIASGLR